jgi:hypothetical protein
MSGLQPPERWEKRVLDWAEEKPGEKHGFKVFRSATSSISTEMVLHANCFYIIRPSRPPAPPSQRSPQRLQLCDGHPTQLPALWRYHVSCGREAASHPTHPVGIAEGARDGSPPPNNAVMMGGSCS